MNYTESKLNTTIDSTQKILPQTPSGEVCLQIVDLYDYKKGWKNFYSKKNPFHIKKISPLRLGIKKYSQHEADFHT